MTVNRPPTALTVARVQAIEIAVNWRWAPVMFLGTWLLAQNVLPARFPAWEISTSWLASAAAVIAGEAALRDEQTLEVLERRNIPGSGDWVRVRTSDGLEGWVTGLVALPPPAPNR